MLNSGLKAHHLGLLKILLTLQKSTQVNLLVEHRSLYATFGKVHGRFLDQADK